MGRKFVQRVPQASQVGTPPIAFKAAGSDTTSVKIDQVDRALVEQNVAGIEVAVKNVIIVKLPNDAPYLMPLVILWKLAALDTYRQ